MSGRAAGPSGLVVPREGLWKAALGQCRKKTNTETQPAWRRSEVSAKLAASTAVGKELGRGCCADGSVCPTWAPQSLCGPCPRLGTALAQVIQHNPVCVHCAAEALTLLLLALAVGWAAGTGVTGLPDADTGSEPPTQERKTLSSVLLLPLPPLTLPSSGCSAPAGSRGGLGVAPTLGSWDWDLTELQGLWFRG